MILCCKCQVSLVRHCKQIMRITNQCKPAAVSVDKKLITPSQNIQRRHLLLQGSYIPLALAGILPSVAQLLEDKLPEVGICPTCVGVVDGTLGTCAGIPACMSSYDDRPGHFIAPWAHEEKSPQLALDKVQAAVEQAGGTVVARQPCYLYAAFKGPFGITDDVEFLLPEEDTTVELRAASRRAALPDAGRIERRFETLRNMCGFEVVPILRNRQRLLGVVESPWDKFGPVPPTGNIEDTLSEINGF